MAPDPLRDLQAAIGHADVDVGELVDAAWEDARCQVQAALTRLLVDDLLRRCHDHLGRTAPVVGAEATDAVYLFGVRRRADARPDLDVRLPDAGPVRWVDGDGIAAVVCDVPTTIVGALQDPSPDGLDLLASAAHAHDRVLAELGMSGPVLPLRLGTVAASDDAVVALLAERRDELTAELERFAGVAEHAVIVNLGTVPTGSPAPELARSGRDYLEGQRDALRARDAGWQRREETAAAVHDRLRRCVLAADRVTPRHRTDGPPPALHGVYLVDDPERFEREVAAVRADHPDAVVEVTGPWPPYHFTAVELGGEATS